MTLGTVIALIKSLGGGGGGGGGGALVVTADIDTGVLDKTAGEIFAAVKSGGAVCRELRIINGVITSEDVFPFAYASWTQQDGYIFAVLFDLDSGHYTYFYASTENDYPATSGGGEE